MSYMTLSIDLETYSSVDIKESGVYAYSASPDFEILLIGYKLDNRDVQIIDLTSGEEQPEFWKALYDPAVIKTAYNANFERTCLAAWTKRPMPPEEWRCTAVRAATLGLPSTLGGVGAALGLPEDQQKNAIGKQLINYFCKPCKPTKTNGGRTRNLPEHAPEKWAQFVEYNRQDVVAEAAILDKLRVYPIPDTEQKLWELDQKMNDRGIALDMDLAEKIIRFEPQYRSRLTAEAVQITGLENPNSLTQLKEWYQQTYGIPITSLTKDTIPEIREQLPTGSGRRMLEIRSELGKTSVKKYQAMQNAVCPDGRLRGILQFYGANRTGRWAGRIVQVHNLPQNKIPDLELTRELVKDEDFDTLEMLFGGLPYVFSQLVRTAFVPSPGCRFVVSDFSAIEARVIAWLADEDWRLKVFRTHGKIYEASAAQMFHVPLDQVKKGSKLRQQGKIAELALGYGGGFGAIKAMDKAGAIPDDEIPMIITNWRKASPKICKFWYNAEAAAKTAIEEHRTVKLKHGLSSSYANKILFIGLPSGRKLAYYDARIEENKKGKEAITYSGVEQDTKHWGRLETWGGKLVENIVQAVARDCLAETMKRVSAAGYQIVMHVHDEIIVDAPKEDTSALDTITAMMAEPILWAPDLPLRGDGFETNFYRKD